MEKDRYSHTAILLKILSVILLLIGLYFHHFSPFIAISLGYFLASRNPLRYRIVVNVGIVFHLLVIFEEIFRLFIIYNKFRILSPDVYITSVILAINLCAVILLMYFYPSPYPVLMNLSGFLFSAESNVNWIEKHPGFIKTMVKKSIIGSIEGLYFNSESFNIVQEEGLLGFSPAHDIIALAERAGVQRGKTLLDVASGLGGPACILAKEYQLNVTGIDLLQRNVEWANNFAMRSNLSSRVKFLRSNAMTLPFENASFDFVFGSDAWCHVPDRLGLLKECYRVLKGNGTLLFFDWVDIGGVTEGFRFIYAFPPLETMDGYREKLRLVGFNLTDAEFDTEKYIKHVSRVKDTLMKNKRRMIDECGRELFDNWNIVLHYTLKMLLEKRLGHGLFIAKK